METNFITGGTGHLGICLVRRLLGQGSRVILLIRASSLKKLGGFDAIVQLIKGTAFEITDAHIEKHIKIVIGDITQPKLGLESQEYYKLASEVTAIFHLAAQLDFTATLDSLRLVNVEGTKNVLDFALACSDHAEFKGLSHISTFAVAGTAKGTFYETDLDIGQQFNNSYEQSKFEAEELVIAYRKTGLNISVFRPSIIVGDSKTGETRSFETLYKPLHFLSLGLFDQLPSKGWTKFNLVPVDSVAEVIRQIIEVNGIKNLNYHLTNPNEIDCTFLLRTASNRFRFRMPTLIPIDQFDFETSKGFRNKLLFPYLPYLNREDIIWDSTNVRNVLRDTGFSWPTIDEGSLERLFDYCIKVGYIKPPKIGPTNYS